MKTQRIVSLHLAVCVLCGAVFMHKPDGSLRDVIVSGRLHGVDHVHTETPEPRPPSYLQGLKPISGITTGSSAGSMYQSLSPTSGTGSLEG